MYYLKSNAVDLFGQTSVLSSIFARRATGIRRTVKMHVPSMSLKVSRKTHVKIVSEKSFRQTLELEGVVGNGETGAEVAAMPIRIHVVGRFGHNVVTTIANSNKSHGTSCIGINYEL